MSTLYLLIVIEKMYVPESFDWQDIFVCDDDRIRKQIKRYRIAVFATSKIIKCMIFSISVHDKQLSFPIGLTFENDMY